MNDCGKATHATIDLAAIGAREFALELNRRGEFAGDQYAYRCQGCRGWHTTRRATWNGTPNRRVYAAKPLRLQEWAMGEAARIERIGLEGLRGNYASREEAVEALRNEALPPVFRKR